MNKYCGDTPSARSILLSYRIYLVYDKISKGCRSFDR